MWRSAGAPRWALALALPLLPHGALAAALPETLAGHGGPITGIVTDIETGRALTASFDYSVILWSLAGEAGVVEKRLIGHEAAVDDVAFIPGGERAISVSDDGSAIVWDLGAGTIVKRLEGSAEKVVDVAVSPDGRMAAIARWDRTARLIDLGSLTETHRLAGHEGNVNAVAFSADSATLYTGAQDGTVRAWDVASGAERGTLYDHGWGVNDLALVGQALVFAGLDGTIGRIALASGAVTTLAHLDSPALTLAVSADGARIAAGFGDGTIRVFTTADGEPLEDYNNPYGPVMGIAFADAAGNALYYTGLDDFASLWRVKPRAPFEQPRSTYPRRFQVRAEASEGALQFQRKCSVCHTLGPDDANRAGPTLYGLFGRRAGSVPGYPYSEGLKRSGIVWNEETIAQLFDHGPEVVTPGSKMPLQKLKDTGARDALIAFLREATKPGGAGEQSR